MSYLTHCGTPGSDVDGCGKLYPSDLKACPKCGQYTVFNSAFPWRQHDYIYDIETYPNIFTLDCKNAATGQRWFFEISDRIHQGAELCDFILALRDCRARMVGYNNIGFDYPVIHFIVMSGGQVTVDQIYLKAMSIITSNRGDNSHVVWDRDRIVTQIDLFKIRHYDNIAKSTSLKALEFAMRMESIQDLPFTPGTPLDDVQKPVLIDYNAHDIEATGRFYARTYEQIEFREKLSADLNRDFLNHNDTKIGKDYFIMKLEETGVQCFYKDMNGKRQPTQTVRHSINLGEVIFPYVAFEHPEFERIRATLASKVITETKGVFKDIECTVDGLTYHFGTGGLHASVESSTVYSDDNYQLVDVDVASYYPNLAIKNRLYPKHLGELFCDIYEDVYNQRQQHAKKTAPNAMMKLALNGVYGDSNNIYSPFYDPFYTMSITINGQLLLCMLAEQLIKIPGLKMIQCNTDGVTYLCPRVYLDHSRAVCKWWQDMTLLTLEEVLYKRMHVRDVNSYIAVKQDDSVKRIGAYQIELEYHQDQSAMVVRHAVNAALINNEDPRDFIYRHTNPYDFMIRAKVQRQCQLVMEWPELDNLRVELQKTTRYYASTDGGYIYRLSPPTGKLGTWKRRNGISEAEYQAVIAELQMTWPLPPGVVTDTDGVPHDERIHTKNKSQHKERRDSLCAGQRVTECARVQAFDWRTLDREWYVREARKLIDPVS